MGSVTLASGSRLYLDANAIIYAAETPERFPSLGVVLDRVDLGDLSAITSALTLAEVLVMPLRKANALAVASYQNRLASGPTLTVADVSRDVLIRAATIRATTPAVKLPDAIHAATALVAGCDVFLTNDLRLRSVPGLRVVTLADLA